MEAAVLPVFAVYLLWVFWFLNWGLGTLLPMANVHKLRWFEEILYRIITLSAVLLLFTFTPWPGIDLQYRLWPRELEDLFAWRLVMGISAALALACWALWHRYAILNHSHRTVTGGPYRLTPHPIYLCVTAAAFATAVFFGRPSSFMGASLLALAFFFKVRIEKKRTFQKHHTAVGMLAPHPAEAGATPIADEIRLSAVPLNVILDSDKPVPAAAPHLH